MWRHRERRDFGTTAFGDARGALFVHFVDANDRLQRNVASFHTRELVFELLFARVDQNLGALAKNQLFYFDKTPHITLIDLPGKNLVDLTTIVENDFVHGLRRHEGSKRTEVVLKKGRNGNTLRTKLHLGSKTLLAGAILRALGHY